MAVTGGRGNPNWTREEVILALDLYFELEGALLHKSAPGQIFPTPDVATPQPPFAGSPAQ